MHRSASRSFLRLLKIRESGCARRVPECWRRLLLGDMRVAHEQGAGHLPSARAVLALTARPWLSESVSGILTMRFVSASLAVFS